MVTLLPQKQPRRASTRLRLALVLVIIVVIAISLSWRYFKKQGDYPNYYHPVAGQTITDGEKLIFRDSVAQRKKGHLLALLRGVADKRGAARVELANLSKSDRPLTTDFERQYASDTIWDWFAKEIAVKYRLRNLPKSLSFQENVELANLAHYSGVTYRKALYDELFYDLGKSQTSSGKLDTASRNLTVVSSAHQNRPMMVVKSLALPGLKDNGESLSKSLGIFAHQHLNLNYVTVGFSSQLGAFIGVNEKKLLVSLHVLPTSETNFGAVPSTVLVNRILSSANSTEEAVTILKDTPIAGSGIFTIASGISNKTVVVEKTPSRTFVRTKHRDVVGDLYTSPKIGVDAANNWRMRQGWPLKRIQNARALLRLVKNRSDMISLASSTKTLDRNELPIGHRASVLDERSLFRVLVNLNTMDLLLHDRTGKSINVSLTDLMSGRFVTPANASWPINRERLRLAWESELLVRRAKALNGQAQARRTIMAALAQVTDASEVHQALAEISTPNEALSHYEKALIGVDDDIVKKSLESSIEQLKERRTRARP